MRGPFANLRRLMAAALLVGAGSLAAAQTTTAPNPGATAYLFAHMTKAQYGVLFYSVSIDGLHWKQLNGGRPVSTDYRGHASIARGADGRYMLVGNQSDDDPDIRFWTSDDLIRWKPSGTYRPSLAAVDGHPHTLQKVGAPKLFFDTPSGQFLLTWHTPNVPGSRDDPERYWASQRTLYVLSKDLVRFEAPPQRLFDWDMATIDTIVVANPAGGYCAIVKDERYPSYIWTTGKTVRISCAPKLTGPYPLPGPPVSPNFREAPTLIRAPNGADWYLYFEQYAGTSYELSMAPRLEGPWVPVWGNTGVPEWNRFEMPAGLRHGSMIQITRKQYDALVAAFPER